jgi:hypothetical protein
MLRARTILLKCMLRTENINPLTSEKLSDLGNSATFYSVLVEVESAKSIP